MADLEKEMAKLLKLSQVKTSTICTAHTVGAMALVHITKSFGASTLGEIGLTYYQLITVLLALNGCYRVDVVFGQYFSLSYKP